MRCSILALSWLMGLVLIVQPAAAAGKVSLSIAQMEIPGGEAVGIELAMAPEAATAWLTVDRVVLEDIELGGLRLDCDAVLLDEEAVGCRGRVRFDSEPTGAVDSALTWRYAFDSERLEFSGNTEHFGGNIQFDGRIAEAMDVDFSVQNIALAELLSATVEGYSFHGGLLSGSGRIEKTGSGPLQLIGRLKAEGLGFDNADGTIAAAELVATGSGTLTLGDADTGFDLDLAPESGELLIDSLYLDLSQAAPRLTVRGAMNDDHLDIEAASLEDGDILRVELSGSMPLQEEGDIGDWRVDLERIVLPGAYDRYLANFTEVTGLGKLSSLGSITGSVELNNTTVMHAALEIRDLSMSDPRGRFAVTGLKGTVEYRNAGDTRVSTLAWQTAAVYEVLLGEAEAEFRIAGDGFELLRPLRMDVFDGALAIDTLAFSQLGESEMTLDFEAHIEPISLRPITDALEWPAMNGTLSGRIPRVTLRNEVVEVGGAIRLEVFDGLVVAEKLRLERIFGVLPTFAGEVTLTDLDLQQMTGAFSFGEIQGRLGGWVKGFRLLDWEPVAFDLDLHTPPDDRSRHRISQRAVDNLSSIGGGPTGILSSGFLRFFDDFRYDSLGLSCHLQNNVCRMGGVGPAPNGGYYIVKGSGIPRINIIGFSREVDFPQLINRLQAATDFGAPTID